MCNVKMITIHILDDEHRERLRQILKMNIESKTLLLSGEIFGKYREDIDIVSADAELRENAAIFGGDE